VADVEMHHSASFDLRMMDINGGNSSLADIFNRWPAYKTKKHGYRLVIDTFSRYNENYFFLF
jgi:hypothetical protein